MVAPKVFISYAREDAATANRLYNDLERAGAKPWLDKNNLRPGEEWKLAITTAIEECDYFIAILSFESVNKRGYVQKELRHALEILDTVPPGEIYVIPARINTCKPTHSRLRQLNWIDLFPSWEEGVKRIQLALKIGEAFPWSSDISKTQLLQGNQPRVRVQFDFSRESLLKLDELVRTTHLTTRAEALRRALTLYTFVLETSNEGNKVLLKKQNGELVEIVLLER